MKRDIEDILLIIFISGFLLMSLTMAAIDYYYEKKCNCKCVTTIKE